MLPTHAREARRSTSSTSAGQTTERQLLGVIFLAFCIVCFGAIFYLPDMTGSQGSQKDFPEVRQVYGGADQAAATQTRVESRAQREPPVRVPVPDPIILDSNHPAELNSAAQAAQPRAPPPPPSPPHPPSTTTIAPQAQQQDDPAAVVSYATAQSKRRAAFVKSMMKTAWDGYATYAWGHNELMPISKRGHSAGIFGRSQMGATIVDAIDTLHIMGLMDEYQKARDWIATQLNFDISAGVSVFEVCIRFVGGLLSIFGLTGDEMFKRLAVEIADKLMPAFNTPTGIPKAMVNLKTGATHNWGWASGGASILSEFGTMQLEFEYLSIITGNPKYMQAVQKVFDFVIKKPRPPLLKGLYPNYLDPNTGNWGSNDVSLGALGDSFYEYLLKIWIFRGGRNSGDRTHRAAYDDAMMAVKDQLVHKTAKGQLYIAEQKNTQQMHKMGHLPLFTGGMLAVGAGRLSMPSLSVANSLTLCCYQACFTGGMLALGAKHAPTPELEQWYLEAGAGVTRSCFEGYHMTKTHIGPEMMTFQGRRAGAQMSDRDAYYILRPEVVESYFVLWRMTHEQKYRDWAWEAVEAIEQHCRCGVGYCGIKNVDRIPVQQDDVQQSFFLAETLKYLYLIFMDDDVISLDKFVMNTEAHPIPIQSQ